MKIEPYILKDDITVVYVNATSFPDGINDAHETLHKIVGPPDGKRSYFGVSRPEAETNGEIVYRAAASIPTADESNKLKLPTLVLKKGEYASILLNDYHTDVTQIARAFELLLEQPNLDENGYCVEWYLKSDVRCMVRLDHI